MAHKVDDTGLHAGIREGRVDGIREAFQAINHGNPLPERRMPAFAEREDVFQSTVFEIVRVGKPEFSPLIGGDPQAQNLAFALGRNAQGHADSLVFDLPAFRVTDFDPQGIEQK